jgi:peptidoglycan-N-acetylglucosamine deacetylase
MGRWDVGGWRRTEARVSARVSRRLVAALAALALLLSACAAQTSSRVSAAPRTTPTATFTATATATPDVEAARNAAAGCNPSAPSPLPQTIFTGARKGATAPSEVALTFDDGPTPATSPPIYDVLERWHAPATFFDEGQYATRWPNLMAREWQDGFAIGVHTWDHPLMTRLTPDQVHRQFADTVSAIRAAIGANVCLWLWRPPYGDVNAAVAQAAAGFGLTTVTWDNSSDDWDRPGAGRIARNVLVQAHPGAIILMHDGPAWREQTALALPYILQGLLDRGLTPVTLPRLLADAGFPGVSVPPAPLPTLTPQPLPPLPPDPTATPAHP